MTDYIPPQLPTREFNGLAFVGDAPRVNDIEKRRPITGSHGGIFEAMLRSADIDIQASFVTNTFGVSLIEDDVGKTRKALGDMWPAFAKEHAERLEAELAAIKPTVIVPMGDAACLFLAGAPHSHRLRGAATMGVGPFARYKLLPTLHPIDIMKSWKWYTVAIGDLIKAQHEVTKGPALQFPTVHLTIRPTMREIDEYLQGCLKAPLISVDIETGWGMVRGISFSTDPSHALYIPFIDLSKPSKSYWGSAADEVQVWRAVKGILESPVPKLGQNFDGYDIHWLLEKMGIRVMNMTHDLRLLHHSIYAELPKSLLFMASAYSSMPGWKHWADHGGTKKSRAGKRDE